MASRVPSKTGSKPSLRKIPSATRSQISGRTSTGSRTLAIAKPSTSGTQPVPEKKEFQLPALSVTYKPKTTTEAELKKMRQTMKRRHAPQGEDQKEIKKIIQGLRNRQITVQEFIGLIAPYTADNGAVLRSVMNDDLNAFRKLARKVYETITQDNSDVLLNQQLQLAEYYRERKALLHDKMMRYIEEIYMMAPNFDFDRFATEKEKYLAEILPIPDELQMEPEEMEMMKRQAAYHRLEWLRSEGERLNEENTSLKKRLQHLKQLHKEEQRKMMEAEYEAERKKEALEAEQASKVETLEQLTESLEKSFIDQESSLRQTKDQAALYEPRQSKEQQKKSKVAKKKGPTWNEKAAYEMEVRRAQEAAAAEASMIQRPRSPFHFSPIKTPPRREPPRERSPFHYSPPTFDTYQSPPRAQAPPPEPAPEKKFGKRGAGTRPRDSWGGFY